MRNVTIEQVHAAYDATEQELIHLEARRAELQNRQIALSLLHQFQCKGVTRSEWIWFIPGNVG
ncbi:MAG: hypothetical protein M3220_10200 [Chloroflexota bacterium]|nr:hypothetical protein [Chloroflexota bacterium]